MKKFIMATIATLVITCFFFISGEIAFRAYQHITVGKKRPTGMSLDDELGWRPSENFEFAKEKPDASGKTYLIEFKTNKDGFKMFGNPEQKEKKKVFFLGDSFTYAKAVSNDKAYYALLEEALSLEVFAYGGEGYGTLQEYMILDKYVDAIQPNIIVIQFCSNDIISNLYELELKSHWNNNGLRRPYFTDRGIIYRIPKNFPLMRGFANNYSKFLYFILSRIDKLHGRSPHSVEEIIAANRDYPLFKESVEITSQLIQKMMSRIPSTTAVYAFSADDPEPYYQEFKNISHKNGIDFIDGLPRALRDADNRGMTTRAADKAHWNEAGHRIAAEVLQSYFETMQN